MQPLENFGPIWKTSRYETQPAGYNKIGFLLVRRQLPFCLLQYSMKEVSRP